MCLAIPGQIRDFDERKAFATVEVASVRRQVNVELLADDGLQEGDWVLIHVGFAMSKLSPEEAGEQLRLLKMLGEEDEAVDEIRGYDFEENYE